MTILETKSARQKFDELIQLWSTFAWMAAYVILSPLTTTLLFYSVFFTSYYPLGFLYICWAYIDKDSAYNGGWSNRFLRRFQIWKYFNEYFPLKVVKTADLSLDKNYLFCYYPHGVMPAGMFGGFGNDITDVNRLYPGLKTHCASLDLNYHLPLFREFCLAMGGISCERRSLVYVLDSEKKGNAVVLAVGGALEALYAAPGPYRIVLKNRKGFVKIALETGASIVPVFSFGEIDIFIQKNPPGSKVRTVQEWFKRILGFAPFFGQDGKIFPFAIITPLKKPITVVVGKPIEVPKIYEPTTEDIEKYHSLFTEALVKLFNEHKSAYAREGDESQLFIE